MEKNLAPIKCTIINNSNKKTGVSKPQLKTDELTDANKTASLTTEEKKKKLEDEIEKVHEQYRKMWRDILLQLKRKKLNEIKVH